MIERLKNNIRKTRSTLNVLSVILVLASCVAVAINGLNLGLDFTGGMVTEVQLTSDATRDQILNVTKPVLGDGVTASQLAEQGRWMIRYPINELWSDTPDLSMALQGISPQVTIVSNSMVGSQVGQEMMDQGGLALLVSMLCILGYLCVRFEWRLASGALLALVHDVIVVLGFFAITQMEFDLTVLAAILAILGYSLNDSIIVADRIRELLIAKQQTPIEEINDQAVLATFSRTIVTSGTTLFTVAALWLMGGDPLKGFATAMFIGIFSGTWSSISIGTILPEKLMLAPKHYLPVEVDTAP